MNKTSSITTRRVLVQPAPQPRAGKCQRALRFVQAAARRVAQCFTSIPGRIRALRSGPAPLPRVSVTQPRVAPRVVNEHLYDRGQYDAIVDVQPEAPAAPLRASNAPPRDIFTFSPSDVRTSERFTDQSFARASVEYVRIHGGGEFGFRPGSPNLAEPITRRDTDGKHRPLTDEERVEFWRIADEMHASF
jgi:hypothetical protein